MLSLLFILAFFTPCGAVGDDDLRLIAHRGGVVDEQHIENNLPAIAEAIRRGYWMLEVDIQESADGHLVVHHDNNFQRYYGDRRPVTELNWAEIEQLRAKPGDLRPLEFSEYAAACRGRIYVMLDVKGEHDEEFFDALEKSLRDNDLLATAFVIGTRQSKDRFRDKAKIGANRRELQAAIDRGEDVSKRYFLFEHGRTLDEQTLELARRHGVAVVPSINTFHYLAGKHEELAAADIKRLKTLGVTHFQIDSVYEAACIASLPQD